MVGSLHINCRGALTALVVFNMTPLYTAESSILMERQAPDS